MYTTQSRKTRLMRTPPCGGKVYIPDTTNTAHHAHTSADSGYSEAEAPSPPALPALGSAVLPATPPLARAHDRSAARSTGVTGVSPAPTKISSTRSSTCKRMVTRDSIGGPAALDSEAQLEAATGSGSWSQCTETTAYRYDLSFSHRVQSLRSPHTERLFVQGGAQGAGAERRGCPRPHAAADVRYHDLLLVIGLLKSAAQAQGGQRSR